MSALVDVREKTARHAYLGLDLAPNVSGKNVARNLGYRLSGLNAIYLTGQKAGEEIEGSVVKAGQSVQLRFGSVSQTRYECLVTYHPQLSQTCVVSTPSVISHGDGAVPLCVTVTAFKQIDLAEFDWFVTLYLLD